MLTLEEWEDGLRFTHVIKDETDTILFKKEYWLGQGGNGLEFESDKHFLSELVKLVNENGGTIPRKIVTES